MKTLFVMFMVLVGVMVTPHADGGDGGGVIPLLKRHEIQVLLAAGFSPKGVAERARVSVDTVERVAREAQVDHVDDDAEHRRRKIGRPSKASPFADAVRRWLLEEPDLPTQELLRRAIEQGYTGRKSAFYELVALARPSRTAAPVVRFEGLPGEFSQHDFGQIDVVFVDGRRKRVHFFASRLTSTSGTAPRNSSARATEPMKSGSRWVSVASAKVKLDAPITATKSSTSRTSPVSGSMISGRLPE